MKPQTIDTSDWCLPAGGGDIRDYEVIRTICTTLKWTSYLARDGDGKRLTLTYLDKDRIMERYKFLAYQNGTPIEETEAEALRQIERFIIDARETVSRIRNLGNEHVAATYGCSYDRERDQFVVVSEYTPGIELNYISTRLKPRQMIFLFAQILDGIDFIHASGYLHLNIKPQRIFVDVEGLPPISRITDFGFAIPKTGYTGEYGGTPTYMAPEVILKRRELIGEKADLYSFGATMYTCLANHQPLQHRLDTGRLSLEAVAAREADIHAPPSQYNREVPPELDEIVMSLLEKEAEKRKYCNAGDLLGVFHQHWPEETSQMIREGTSTLVSMT